MNIGIEFDHRFQMFSGTDSSLAVFRSGAKVRGQVLLIIPHPSPIPVRQIVLELSGDRILLKSRFLTTLLSHRESLLLGDDRGVLLCPGRHVFPFVFEIPSNLPSTFIGAHAHVQYFAKAVVEPTSELPLEVTEPFVIFSRPRAKTVSLRKTTEQEGVVSKWKLERRDFQQNEFLFINGEVTNRDNGSLVTALTATLSMEAEFQSPDGKCLFERQELASIRDPVRLSKKQGIRWRDMSLHIPRLAPSSCDGAGNCPCKISYQLELRVERDSRSTSTRLTVPIIIGSEVLPYKILHRRPEKENQFDISMETALANHASKNSSFRETRAAIFKCQASNCTASLLDIEGVVVKSNPLFIDEESDAFVALRNQDR